MNLRTKKILKHTIQSLLGLIAIAFLIISIALNFIFTPSKITPKIVAAINENIDAELSVESIGLTFFSTFPNFTLEIENGLVSRKIEFTT